MGWLTKALNASIGKKVIMSITGLCLVGFLLVHLSGNMLLFSGEAAFNNYAHFLLSLKAIKFAELILLGIFVAHVITAIKLTLGNQAARPQKYEMNVTAGKANFASSNMFLTGSIILAFLVVHIITLKYGGWNHNPVDGVGENTLYDLTLEWFKNPAYVGGYIVAMMILGLHIKHGFQSAFQSLGLNHSKFNPMFKGLGLILTIAYAVGFSVFPLYFFIK